MDLNYSSLQHYRVSQLHVHIHHITTGGHWLSKGHIDMYNSGCWDGTKTLNDPFVCVCVCVSSDGPMASPKCIPASVQVTAGKYSRLTLIRDKRELAEKDDE